MNVCTCMAVEANEDYCSCACDWCVEFCLDSERDYDEDEDGRDCMQCGTCDDCVRRCIAYAEEMESLP